MLCFYLQWQPQVSIPWIRVNRVSDTTTLSNETYEAVKALKTTQDQMRDILKFVTSAGTRGKDALFEILQRMKSMRPLIVELKESESE